MTFEVVATNFFITQIEKLEVLNVEARELEGRIAENVALLLEGDGE